MNKPLFIILICLFNNIIFNNMVAGQSVQSQFGSSDIYSIDTPNFHIDNVYWDHDELRQTLYIENNSKQDSFELSITGKYEDVNGSIKKIFYKREVLSSLQKGLNTVMVVYDPSKSSDTTIIDESFYKVVHKFNLLPVGNYQITVHITSKKYGYNMERAYYFESDTALNPTSALADKLNAVFVNRNQLSGNLRQHLPLQTTGKQKKTNKIFSQKQIDAVMSSDSSGYQLYFESWRLGYYAIPNSMQSIENNYQQYFQPSSIGIDGLPHNKGSLMDQFQTMGRDQKKDKEIRGDLYASSSWANGQEQGSDYDNNYYEIGGTVTAPILGMPISLSGYYTTQDKKRVAKASYFRFHYDIDEAKTKLSKLMNGYKSSYDKASASGSSLQMIYGQYAQQLKQESATLSKELLQEAKQTTVTSDSNGNVGEMNEAQFKILLQQYAQKYKDSATAVASSKTGKEDSAKVAIMTAYENKKEALNKKYDQYLKLQQKAAHYQQLLTQYQNTLHFDSLTSYKQMISLNHYEDMSYKDLSKSASNILPQGKVKSFLTGISSFDAGIFPQYTSAYTMGGQMLKGISVGYDMGMATVNLSGGTTEYVDRTGGLDNYKAYSLGVTSKAIGGQQVGFIYYTYLPSGNPFSKTDGYNFNQWAGSVIGGPVNILATTYKSTIGRYLSMSGEWAISKTRTALGTDSLQEDGTNATDKGSLWARSAANIALNAAIPFHSMTLEGVLEHSGNNFVNNTLPINLSGTEKLSIKTTGDILQSFMTLGLEYNYLIQNNFSYKGGNSRWGFEISTHSRRYPTVTLSYKPFSTFRSYTDTLATAQKPLYGDVWTGRASYQLKMHERTLRFSGVLSRNKSVMDTIKYVSLLLQGNVIYTMGNKSIMLLGGYNNVRTNLVDTISSVYNNSFYISSNANTAIGLQWIVSGGIDLAANNNGFNRYGFNMSLAYRLKQLPIAIRGLFRYNRYKYTEETGWQPLFNSGLMLTYQFKMKLKSK